MLKPIPLLLVLAVLSIDVCAEEFDHVQVDVKTCTLVHSGNRNKGIVYEGKLSFGHCFINVPFNEFKKTYSFCALSGVLARKGIVMCEFGFSDLSRSEVYFMSGPDVLCEFVCARR